MAAFGFYVVRVVKRAFVEHVCVSVSGWRRCSFCTASTRLRKEERAKWWTASTWLSSCREKTQRPSRRSPRCAWTSPTPGQITATSCCSPRTASLSKWRWSGRSSVCVLFRFFSPAYTHIYSFYMKQRFRLLEKLRSDISVHLYTLRCVFLWFEMGHCHLLFTVHTWTVQIIRA